MPTSSFSQYPSGQFTSNDGINTPPVAGPSYLPDQPPPPSHSRPQYYQYPASYYQQPQHWPDYSPQSGPPPPTPFGLPYPPTIHRPITPPSSHLHNVHTENTAEVIIQYINSPSPLSKSKGKKRAAPSVPTAARKQKKKKMVATPVERIPFTEGIIHGIGPSTQPLQQPAPCHPAVASPSTTAHTPHVRGYPSLIRQRHNTMGSKASNDIHIASDVWYAVRGLQSGKKPDVAPDFGNDPPSKDPVKAPWIGCRFCEFPKWSTWENSGGLNNTIRAHMRKYHNDEWVHLVLIHELKNHEKLRAELAAEESDNGGAREPFSIEGFHELLARWIAVDDQSINIVECPELRKLFLYLCSELDDDDIPHRTKTTELLVKLFEKEHVKLAEDMKASLGRISFTTDLWTDKLRRGYLAITAHYIVSVDNRLVMRSRLAGFRYVRGSHTGEWLAKHFLDVIKELGVIHKIGMITQDNASNCGTMMADLAIMLKQLDPNIIFDADGNRIRCFSHVVNIAVQTALKEFVLVDNPTYGLNSVDVEVNAQIGNPEGPDFEAQENAALTEDPEYFSALLGDTIAATRILVAACRASGQRREGLEECIVEGNGAKAFGKDEVTGDDLELPLLQLLRDVEIRWSSTFLMIDRVLFLNPVIDLFLNKDGQASIEIHRLSDAQLDVLEDIRDFLRHPHLVQEVLSAQHTPTLSLVIPTYETLIANLKLLTKTLPRIAHAIRASIWKLEHYLKLTRKTHIYALAMVLNPTKKLSLMDKHWDDDEKSAALASIREAMLSYRKAMRDSNPESVAATEPASSSVSRTTSTLSTSSPSGSIPSRSTRAARNQLSGALRLESMTEELEVQVLRQGRGRRTRSNMLLQSPARDLEPGPLLSSVSQSTVVDEREREQRSLEEDIALVEKELKDYLEEPLLKGRALAKFDLLLFWEGKELTYPILYRIALDVLPVQASSVPCERVFSSSKETDTLRRSNLSTSLMEVLQMLKYVIREERVSFTESWTSKEHELAALSDEERGVTAERCDALLAEGRISELRALLQEHSERRGADNSI